MGPEGGNSSGLAPAVQTGSAADHTTVNNIVNVKPIGTPQQQEMAKLRDDVVAARGGQAMPLPKADKQQPSISQAHKLTPAEEKSGKLIAYQKEMAALRAKANAADPYASTLGASPGVQGGLALVIPSVGIAQGTAQTIEGARTGSKTDMVLGLVSIGSGFLGRRGAAASELARMRSIEKAAITEMPKSAMATGKRIDANIDFAKTAPLFWEKVSGVVRDAAKGKGNFGLGNGTFEEAMISGHSWVGEGFDIASDAKTMVSADKFRQFRPPSYKPRLDKVQANFEWRNVAEGRWQGNGHLDISK